VRFGIRGLALVICALACVVLGGAGATSASTTSDCNQPAPSGRLVCLTIKDIDGVSPSGHVGSGARQADVVAYQFYEVTVSNGGGNSLTNGTLTVTLTDKFAAGVTANSTALYVPSPSTPFCAAVSTNPNRVSCTIGNLPAGGVFPTFVLAYRTSNSAGVLSTDGLVSASFKEGGNGPNGANPATFSLTENTSLEPNPQASSTWSPSAQTVKMGTSPTFDQQFTTLDYSVPAAKPSFIASLNESNGSSCAPTLTSCFGELVTTDLTDAADGTFSPSNLFHLQLTMSLGLFPGGNTDNIVLSHQLEGGGFEVISRRCTTSPPGSTETLPCIKVTVLRGQTQLLIIDAWGYQNGGWHPGLS
jgi:hypothetical protein